MSVTEDNEGTLAVLVDYITSTSNATVDLVKSGADILEKLVDDATNLSKVCKHQMKTAIMIFYTQNDAQFAFFFVYLRLVLTIEWILFCQNKTITNTTAVFIFKN